MMVLAKYRPVKKGVRMYIMLAIKVFPKNKDEDFIKQLLEKYPEDYVKEAFKVFLIEKKGRELQYSYSLDELTDDDKKWLVDWIEMALESDAEAEAAAAVAEAEAMAEAEFQAEMEATRAETEAYYYEEPLNY